VSHVCCWSFSDCGRGPREAAVGVVVATLRRGSIVLASRYVLEQKTSAVASIGDGSGVEADIEGRG
jgi:hypothetical protein